MGFPLIGLLKIGGKLIDKLIPDKTAAAAAKLKLYEMEHTGELKELETVANIVTAEAKSEHFLVAAWRPITMLSFVAIIVNNYLLYPYLSLFWNEAPILVLPPDMWKLLQIGLGGYVVGRSTEKAIKNWKGDK